MSKISAFIHSHASVFKVGTEVLGVAIAELPVPQALKDPLMEVLVEMNRTANNMGDNANVVAQNLLGELSSGAQASVSETVNPQLQSGLALVSQLSSSAAAILSSSGGNVADKVTVQDPAGAPMPFAPVGPVAPSSAPATVQGVGMQQTQPGPTDAPAAPVPVSPVGGDPPPQIAPATQVALGIAVDPNSAHVGPADPQPAPAEPAPVLVDPQPVQAVTGPAMQQTQPGPTDAPAAPIPGQPVTEATPLADQVSPAVTADAPTDPGLATKPATDGTATDQDPADPITAAEQRLTAAISSGDNAAISEAAQALADATKGPTNPQ